MLPDGMSKFRVVDHALAFRVIRDEFHGEVGEGTVLRRFQPSTDKESSLPSTTFFADNVHSPLGIVLFNREVSLLGFIIPDHPAFARNLEESASSLFAGKLDEGVDAITSALRVHSLRT